MNTKQISYYLILLLLIVLLFGCEKWDFENRSFVNTGEPLQLKVISATFRGQVTNSEAVSVLYVGHCWSNSNVLPSIDDDSTQLALNTTDGSFVSVLEPLRSNEIYYVRGYAKLSSGAIYYGAVKTFATASIAITTESVINMESKQVEVVGRILGPGLDASNVLDSIGHTWALGVNIDPQMGKDSATHLSKSTEGVFKSRLTNLINGLNYQVRSYAVENGEILYGNTLNFRIGDVWEKKEPLDESKFGGVSFVINERAFVGLGRINENTPSKTFFMYDPAKDQWENIPDFPGAPRFGAVAFTIGNKAYVGLGTNDNNDQIGEYFNDFWVFDYPSMSWSELPLAAAFPGDGVAYASAFSLGGIGYVGLGYFVSMVDGYIYTTRTFYRFNPTTEQWEVDDSLFLPGRNWKSKALCFVDRDNNLAYIGGGENSNLDPKNDLWQFTPEIGWDSLSILLPGTPRAEGVAFVIDRKAYIGTGTGNFFPNARKDFWAFNLETQQWSQKANLSGTVRIGSVGFSIKNKGYIAAGSGCAFGICTDSFNDLWEYIPE